MFLIFFAFFFSVTSACFAPPRPGSATTPAASVSDSEQFKARGYYAFVEATEENYVQHIATLQAEFPNCGCRSMVWRYSLDKTQSLALIRNPLDRTERIILLTQNHGAAEYHQLELVAAKIDSVKYFPNYETQRGFFTYEGFDNLFYAKEIDLSDENFTLIDIFFIGLDGSFSGG